MSRAQRSATLGDVAERAGVSAITASRILNGSRGAAPVAPATRRRVERAATALGYRLNAVARAMRHRRSGMVGAVVANSAAGLSHVNLPGYEYLLGLNQGLDERGYVLSLVRLAEAEDGVDARNRALDEHLLDAVVVVGFLPAGSAARIRRSIRAPIWLDTDVDEPRGCLRRDEVAAGRDAARLLLASGRRRVLWPQRPPAARAHYSFAQREAGARAACADAGAAFTAIALTDDFACDPAVLRRAVGASDAGLLAADPQMTRALQWWLGLLGIRPGHDVGLATCDADSHLARLCPGLSRVEVDRFALGRRAAAMAADCAESGKAPASALVASAVVAGDTA
jgi:DNA-binding LacI/PurR family transcriptional regulator